MRIDTFAGGLFVGFRSAKAIFAFAERKPTIGQINLQPVSKWRQ